VVVATRRASFAGMKMGFRRVSHEFCGNVLRERLVGAASSRDWKIVEIAAGCRSYAGAFSATFRSSMRRIKKRPSMRALLLFMSD
jgi:hypothetical protein